MLTVYYIDPPLHPPSLSPLPSPPPSEFCAPDDERNLLYVAASRAKSQLILSPMCIAILKKSGVSEPLLFSFLFMCVCVCVLSQCAVYFQEHFVYPTAEACEALSEVYIYRKNYIA